MHLSNVSTDLHHIEWSRFNKILKYSNSLKEECQDSKTGALELLAPAVQSYVCDIAWVH